VYVARIWVGVAGTGVPPIAGALAAAQVFPTQVFDAHWVAFPEPQADSAGEGKQRNCRNRECGEAVFFVTPITGFPPCVVVDSELIAGIV
jgi:hypothetical protein